MPLQGYNPEIPMKPNCSSLLLALTMALVSGQVEAQSTEYLEFGPPDPQINHRFGYAVAIKGSWAVVGANGDNGNGPASGAVYVVNWTTGQQLHKLVPTDLALGDQFGSSVAIDGKTVIVGAPKSDASGHDSGAAYVFDLETGAQLAKLVPNHGRPEANFGAAVGIDGSVIIVGAPFESHSDKKNGAAYLFDALSGHQLGKLVSSDLHNYDNFGAAVVIQGNRAVVGAPGADTSSKKNVGAVYVFDVVTGTQIRKLLSADKPKGQQFGSSLAASGTNLIAGAPFDDSHGKKSGAAYLLDISTGQELAKLLPEDGGPYEYFGWSVGISGTRAVVGAYYSVVLGMGTGAAYVFDTSTGQQVQKLIASDGEGGDALGWSVGLDGSAAIAGARDKNTSAVGAGKAYVFYPESGWERSPFNGHWYLATNIERTWAGAEAEARCFGGHLATIRNQAENDWLVSKLRQDSSSRWIGYNDLTVEGQFEWVSGEPSGFENWYPGEPDDSGGADWTSWDSVTGMWFDEPQSPERPSIVEVISQDCDGDNLPDAYQIARDPSLDWDGNGILDSCSPPNFCIALINSTGMAAGIGAQGSPVLAEESVTLTAWDLPLNETGYFMTSETRGYLPHFGGSAGILCLDAPIYRFSSPASGGAVLDSGDTGTVELTLDLGHLPSGVTFDPGETWYFQLWYRDVDSSGPTSNTTDGLTVLFR